VPADLAGFQPDLEARGVEFVLDDGSQNGCSIGRLFLGICIAGRGSETDSSSRMTPSSSSASLPVPMRWSRFKTAPKSQSL
jgi:hypothetical protein